MPAFDVTEWHERSQGSVRCQKCEIPADSYTMMPGSSICELCQFEEAAHFSGNETGGTCRVCGDAGEVRSIDICGDELLVCRSCDLSYFATPRAVMPANTLN